MISHLHSWAVTISNTSQCSLRKITKKRIYLKVLSLMRVSDECWMNHCTLTSRRKKKDTESHHQLVIHQVGL